MATASPSPRARTLVLVFSRRAFDNPATPMADAPDHPQQTCPACGAVIDAGESEPLAKLLCPACGEKFRVQASFDHFELVETLGAGGMGAVYKARDTRLDRFVALKLLLKELSANPAEAARLEQEARVAAAINHPNVVQVYSAGSARGQIYLVMELVDHGSLDDLMAQHARVPEAQVLSAGIQVAKGLQAAQQKGLIHRDVKPANILFADESTAKIGDFGLAVAAGQKAEAQKEIWGTPYYVAPERLNNAPEDFRSDIYSLGATLFHALAGKPPMEGESTSASELRRLKSHPPDLGAVAPDISRETARIINKMLAPNPANRFTSYAHLIAQLQRAARALPGPDGGAAKPRRGRLLPIGAAVAALLLALGFYLWKQQGAAVSTVGEISAPGASPGKTAPLEKKYESARRQLLDGKTEAAATAFAKLATEAKDRQPLLNWIRLHAGLATLLQGKSSRDFFLQIANETDADAELARFFQETARRLTASGPVRANSLARPDPKSPDAFALFLFGAKNWQLREFDEAAALFERFLGSESPTEFAWINDYKPLARNFVEDQRIHAEWTKLPARFASAAEMRTTIDQLRALQKKLQTRGALAEFLKDEATRLSNQLTQREKKEKEAREEERKELLAEETPRWEEVRGKVRQALATYDFGGAIALLDGVVLDEASLKKARDEERQRAAWLAEWKTKLIADLNSGRYRAEVSDLPNVVYEGVGRASDSAITLRIPGGRGSAPVKWTQLTSRTLLAMSTAFIAAHPNETAERQWLAAVFAQTTGQTDLARPLAEAAAKTNPEYRETLKSLLTE